MTVQTLVLLALVLGTALYFLLVRRRVAGRLDVISMSRALTSSNQIALERMRRGPRDRAEAMNALEDSPIGAVIAQERRSGSERRTDSQRSRGRGRRAGGDRRRGRRPFSS